MRKYKQVKVNLSLQDLAILERIKKKYESIDVDVSRSSLIRKAIRKTYGWYHE